jgi:hypothetical protein
MQKGRRMKGTSPNRKGPEQRSGKAEIRVLEGLLLAVVVSRLFGRRKWSS